MQAEKNQTPYFFKPSWCVCALILLTSACERAIPPSDSFEVATQGLHSAALSENSEYVFVSSINHGGSLWRTQDKERVFNWNHGEDSFSTIIAADFADNWGLTAEIQTLVLWDVKEGTATRYWTAPSEILDIKLGPQGKSAVLGLGDHTAVLFDVQRGGILRTFRHENRVRSVDISHNGEIIVTGSEDYSARVWEANSGKLLSKQTHQDDVQLVVLSRDGALVLSVSKYDKAIVWNSKSGEIVGEIPLKAENLKRGLRFSAGRFSQNNKYLLTGKPNQAVDLWDLQNFRLVHQWVLPKRNNWKPTSTAVLALGFGKNDGEYYAIASNGFVHRLTEPR